MKVHITGIAGFIGFHVAKQLMERGHLVTGNDILTDYYDVMLKVERIKELGITLSPIQDCDVVLHLAAQPGVMYSKNNPMTYIDNNVSEFVRILEYCRYAEIPFVYASSSTAIVPRSVYGLTKHFDEMIAGIYRYNYGMDILGLRFYSVYGPWGRPDMAIWKWTEQILHGDKVVIRGKNTMRDFSYVDDVAKTICITLEDQLYALEMVDIGRGNPRKLDDVLDILESSLGTEARREYSSLYKEEEEENRTLNPQCSTEIEEGLPKFVNWYLNHGGK